MPNRNYLLAALPENELSRLRPALEPVRLPLGSIVFDAGERIRHVYFPVAGIVSLLYVTQSGKCTELAVIGREGMVGASLALGSETTPHQSIVQSAAEFFRLPADTLKEGFAQGGRLRLVVLRFTQSLIAQICQTAVCNRHHSLEQRLCRWLLLSLDRLPDNRLQMTHDLIANMLGVRRQGVTEAAGKLVEQGIVTYSRGLVTIVDRAGLEARACECYAGVREETARLLADFMPR